MLVTSVDNMLLSNWRGKLDNTVGFESFRPVMKVAFADCYSMPEDKQKSSVALWDSKYQTHRINCSVEDAFMLLSILYGRHEIEPPSRRIFVDRLKTSFLCCI